MDPNVTLRHLLDALRERDRDLVLQALEDLVHWVAHGGFLPTPTGELKDEVATVEEEIAEATMFCREYITLECAARIAHQAGVTSAPSVVTNLREMARTIIDGAPDHARRDLDLAKRILEIDQHCVNPTKVLLLMAVGAQ